MKNLNPLLKILTAIAITVTSLVTQHTHAQPYQSIFGDSTTQFNVFVPERSMKGIESFLWKALVLYLVHQGGLVLLD